MPANFKPKVAGREAAGLGIQETPTFHPTPEEFADPLRYIASIRPIAEPYGVCKIVPPPGWKPPFAIDRSTFKFKTRIQHVHELQERAFGAQDAAAFAHDYDAFLQQHGKRYKVNPFAGGQEVDLARLFRAVQKRGGFDEVSSSKGWKDVARALQVSRWAALASMGGAPPCPLLPVLGPCLAGLLRSRAAARRRCWRCVCARPAARSMCVVLAIERPPPPAHRVLRAAPAPTRR